MRGESWENWVRDGEKIVIYDHYVFEKMVLSK